MAEQLGEKYLMPEVMAMPERADEQVFYQILKMAEKSMLEKMAKSRANGKNTRNIWAMDPWGQNSDYRHEADLWK